MSRPLSEQGRENFDRIFKPQKKDEAGIVKKIKAINHKSVEVGIDYGCGEGDWTEKVVA